MKGSESAEAFGWVKAMLSVQRTRKFSVSSASVMLLYQSSRPMTTSSASLVVLMATSVAVSVLGFTKAAVLLVLPQSTRTLEASSVLTIRQFVAASQLSRAAPSGGVGKRPELVP